jgi:hypothetical protein
MSEKVGTTQDAATKPSDSSEQLDNAPFWWHEVIYDEMRSGYMKPENT